MNHYPSNLTDNHWQFIEKILDVQMRKRKYLMLKKIFLEKSNNFLNLPILQKNSTVIFLRIVGYEKSDSSM